MSRRLGVSGSPALRVLVALARRSRSPSSGRVGGARAAGQELGPTARTLRLTQTDGDEDQRWGTTTRKPIIVTWCSADVGKGSRIAIIDPGAER